MPVGYLPLSSENDQDRELNAAFDDEEEDIDGHETSPLTGSEQRNPQHSRSRSGTTGYDFERDYDWIAPPAGSPSDGTGIIPTSAPQIPQRSGPNLFRRALAAVLPSQYSRLPTSDGEASSAHRVGHGNDGVFANIMGKPTVAQTVRTDDGQVHMVPESVQKDVPPTYVEAQADSVPPYWETTVHAPTALLGDGEMLVDDLPTGSFLTFIVTMGISFFFQLVGFLLTYLLHTSHAGRYGALGGMGLTLISYGFTTKMEDSSEPVESTNYYAQAWWHANQGANAASATALAPEATISARDDEAVTPSDDTYVVTAFSTKDWLSFFIMTIGWFFLLSSIIGFLRVKRWERRIRDSASGQPTFHSPEDMQHDQQIRRNLESVFGLSTITDTPVNAPDIRDDGNGNVIVLPGAQLLEEARLTRDLRAAGLL